MIKSDKGISLLSLVITIVIMTIIASVTINTSKDRYEINNINKMINDIELLEDKVSNYYLRYNAIPVVRDVDNNIPIEYKHTTISFDTNINDDEVYYILDLAAMPGITLNYGQEGFENINQSDDVYIINNKTHHIYYVRGIELDEVFYHSMLENNKIADKIPPSKPEIKIISGKQNEQGVYTTAVSIEFVPGKDSTSGIEKTTYSINDETEKDISTLTNNMLTITEDGPYTINVKSYNNSNSAYNYSENSIDFNVYILKIGDKVAYDEGIEKTSDIDSNFKMKDLEWRILDIEDDGTIELISTQPTESQFYVEKVEGSYLNYESNLDKLCDDLYGKGIGALKARSLKLEDVNKILGEDFDIATENSRYGKYFWYKFDNTLGQIQYSTDYNEETGTGTWTNTGYTSLKDPREKIIDSNNYLDEKGELRILKLQHNYACYILDDQDVAKLTTRDGILMSRLITQGLDNTNTQASGTEQKYWLSSKYIDCSQKYVGYGVFRISDGGIGKREFFYSYGEEIGGYYYYVVRPVVILKSNIDLILEDGEWKINI